MPVTPPEPATRTDSQARVCRSLAMPSSGIGLVTCGGQGRDRTPTFRFSPGCLVGPTCDRPPGEPSDRLAHYVPTTRRKRPALPGLDRTTPDRPPAVVLPGQGPFRGVVAGGGFEPPKLSRRFYRAPLRRHITARLTWDFVRDCVAADSSFPPIRPRLRLSRKACSMRSLTVLSSPSMHRPATRPQRHDQHAERPQEREFRG
jgi:hypothetical protein